MGDTRTANEVAGLRALAREAHGQSDYRTAVSEAVTATLDWLGGATTTTPVTGDEAAPEDARVALERIRAEDAEQLALRRGQDGTRPGVVGQTISWWQRRPFSDAPLL